MTDIQTFQGKEVKMKENIGEFKKDVDEWIKKLHGDLIVVQSKVGEMPIVLDEHEGNINHNYEMIQDMQKTIEELKQEIRELKAMQVISLKSRPISEIKY